MACSEFDYLKNELLALLEHRHRQLVGFVVGSKHEAIGVGTCPIGAKSAGPLAVLRGIHLSNSGRDDPF